jgi:hypothetical protein
MTISSWLGLSHGCPVERLRQRRIERPEPRSNCKYALPGLVPGIHVLAAGIIKAQEDVDAHGSSPWAEGPRVKPGQGDLWLCMDHCKQPISLNRTAVGLVPAIHACGALSGARLPGISPGMTVLVACPARRCDSVASEPGVEDRSIDEDVGIDKTHRASLP